MPPTVGGGSDSEGRVFRSTDEMWQHELKSSPDAPDGWYTKAINYWEHVDATVDGVLGGFAFVSDADLRESNQFLFSLKLQLEEGSRVVDCGAGIGRISEGLLRRHFTFVDVLEPVKSFIDEAKKRLGPDHRGEFLQIGLQHFNAPENHYDCVWIQWVIGHLTDDDFIAFIRKCKASLKPNGVIIVKENIAQHGFVVDREDSSVTRSDAYLRQLFKQAGVEVIASAKQKEFPKELFRVHMFALR